MLAVHIFKFCPTAIADLSLIWQQPLYFRCIYSEGITRHGLACGHLKRDEAGEGTPGATPIPSVKRLTERAFSAPAGLLTDSASRRDPCSPSRTSSTSTCV
jgi:hypothetical protein